MKWFFADVFKMMHCIGWDEYSVAFATGFFLSVTVDAAFAVDDKDLVLPTMRVVG